MFFTREKIGIYLIIKNGQFLQNDLKVMFSYKICVQLQNILTLKKLILIGYITKDILVKNPFKRH